MKNGNKIKDTHISPNIHLSEILLMLFIVPSTFFNLYEYGFQVYFTIIANELLLAGIIVHRRMEYLKVSLKNNRLELLILELNNIVNLQSEKIKEKREYENN